MQEILGSIAGYVALLAEAKLGLELDKFEA